MSESEGQVDQPQLAILEEQAWIARPVRRLLRHWLLFSLLLIGVLPFSIWGALQSWRNISNDVADWMPDDVEARNQFDRFYDLFGSDELLMISWDGCTLDDERVELFQKYLLEPTADRDVFFREVLTGPEILEFYRSAPLNLSREEAEAKMSRWVLSSSGEPTCLIALVSPTGEENRPAAVESVYASAERVPGLERDDVRMAGPTMEGVAINNASRSRLAELNIASFSICLAIMVISLRSWRAAAIVFLLAVFNEQLSMAVIYYSGTIMDSVLMLTANLTFVITIAIGIHLVNYYRDAQHVTNDREAPVVALTSAFKPTVLATVTTALGLISLSISEVTPLYRFGLYSAVSIILAAPITMLYLSLHFSIWPLSKKERKAEDEPALDRELGSQGWMSALRVASWPILLLTVASIVVGVLGTRRLQTSVGLRELLTGRTRVIRDYRWLEENVGPLTPVEIVLEMPAGDAREMLKQFRTVAALHSSLVELDLEPAVISTASFSPDPPPKRGGFRQVAMAAAFRRKLLANQERLRTLGYLLVEDNRHFWRITLRCPAMQRVDYGDLLQQVERVVDDTMSRLKEDQEGEQPLDVLVCGAVPLIYQVQQQLLDDLINSFGLAFGLVCVTLMLLFRSFLCGLICMIPNLLPAAVVFGAMGWWGLTIEVGTVLTACAALGVAVDDSLHFITWFRWRVLQGAPIPEAVRFAYRRCAAAMVQTTLICSFGLVVFAFSEFAPIVRFGWCMFTLLIVALIADLIVLPAILLTPLGRPFLPRR